MEAIEEAKMISPLVLIGSFAVLSLGYFLAKAIYDIKYGPLSHIPGPKLTALSWFPYVRMLLSGATVPATVRLHKKHGDVVRISPREVSFTSAATAFPDIYGFRTGKLKGHVNMQKDPQWYGPPVSGTPSILMANDADHSRGRKVLAHAFSEKALAAQEPLLQDYTDQLIKGLKREVAKQPNAAQDLVKWYNWTTFDIITDLTFGEPLGSLRENATHKYLTLLLDTVISSTVMQTLQIWPWLQPIKKHLVQNKNVLTQRAEFGAYVSSRVEARIARSADAQARPDFMTEILAHNTHHKDADGHPAPTLALQEIKSNAVLMLTAGSETTATLLSGASFLLMRHPDVTRKLQQEIRSAFAAYDEITLERVNRLPYLIAVLTESLRYFPPVPAGFVRQVGPGGEMVSGVYIPEGTAVSVSQFAAYHSEENFVDADAFIPERWLDEATGADAATVEKFRHDRRAALQPFSFGPRACLGRNLAYAEMRLILAKMVWSFDFELFPGEEDWMERCKLLRLWVKPELRSRVRVVDGRMES